MPNREDVPRTVGAALENGWQWLGVHCDHCRQGTRIALARRPWAERLGEIAAKLRCTRCGEVGNRYLRFVLGTEIRSEREKPIGFSGLVAVKISMN
jgi:hypothetical protein